jgi:hypothetical protein
LQGAAEVDWSVMALFRNNVFRLYGGITKLRGLSFNPYNIVERAGLMLFEGSPEHRQYLFVRNRL